MGLLQPSIVKNEGVIPEGCRQMVKLCRLLCTILNQNVRQQSLAGNCFGVKGCRPQKKQIASPIGKFAVQHQTKEESFLVATLK
mmetsp:Transcript_102189/g.207906  ORF Transcript_102189/g.207906 Transcript_102189/m.207906 type:complete len:84 (+) Transcript_102189:623-874(+)